MLWTEPTLLPGDVGYTKRPALIDPIDWEHGWPVLRGGRGPSDSSQPGPVAQPGQRRTYHPDFVSVPQPGRLIPQLSDAFDGTALSSRWSWIRPPAGADRLGGNLTWKTQAADLHPETAGSPLASVLSESAPSGNYVVDTKVRVDVPADGCCQNYVQGGVLIYGDDGNYVKLASVSIFDTRQTEFGKEITPVPAGYPHYGNTVVGPVGTWIHLRIIRHRVAGHDAYTADTSLAGWHYDTGGTWTADLGAHPRIGLISMGGLNYTTSFGYLRVSRLADACGP